MLASSLDMNRIGESDSVDTVIAFSADPFGEVVPLDSNLISGPVPSAFTPQEDAALPPYPTPPFETEGSRTESI